MGIFGRSKKNQTEESVEETGPVTPEGEPGVDRDWDRSFDGPYDVSERPEVKGRVDLGALRVPAVPGMEMRLDVDKATSSITGLTCSIQGSKLQLQAFAAPRSEGLWEDIRKGLAEGVKAAEGTATIDSNGVMGKELLTQMPVKDASGATTGVVTNRFIGVDGPRWFLRAVVNGPAATEGRQLDVVRKFLRQVVVDRGTEPRPPREVLALTAPKGVVEEATRRRTAARAAAAARRAGAGVSGAAAAGSAPGSAAGASAGPDAAAGSAAAGNATGGTPAEGTSPAQDGTGSES